MPLPLVLIGIAAASAIFGAGKGVQAVSDNSKARSLDDEAQDIFDTAKRKMVRRKSLTKKALEQLGEVKLNAWNDQIGKFVKTFSKIKYVRLTGGVSKSDHLAGMTRDELAEMKQISLQASEVVGGGLVSLGTGVLAGFGAYGGATMFAAASTGTAISTLSGVAATNATLAWFGGGSLAAGGLGMAGGTLVLGGLVAGPALLVGGYLLSAKAKQKLAAARSNYAQSEEAAAQMSKVETALKGIEKVARQYTRFIEEVANEMTPVLGDLKKIVTKSGIDYRKYSKEQRKKVHLSVEYAHLLKSSLEAPLLTKNGNLKRGISKNLNELGSARENLLES